MAYCTTSYLIVEFGEDELIQLSDRPNGLIINNDVLQSKIDAASAIIDGYLGAYQLPLVNVPANFQKYTADIARYFLYDDMKPEPIKAAYDAAILYFEKVAEGKIKLGVDLAGVAPVASDLAVMETGGRTFDRKDKGFI